MSKGVYYKYQLRCSEGLKKRLEDAGADYVRKVLEEVFPAEQAEVLLGGVPVVPVSFPPMEPGYEAPMSTEEMVERVPKQHLDSGANPLVEGGHLASVTPTAASEEVPAEPRKKSIAEMVEEANAKKRERDKYLAGLTPTQRANLKT